LKREEHLIASTSTSGELSVLNYLIQNLRSAFCNADTFT
ncbi:hypothetical protein T02_11159, partial [Trichinella nativa]